MSKEFPECPYCGRSGEPIALYDELMESQVELRTQLAVQAELLREVLEVVREVAGAPIVLDTYTGSDVLAINPVNGPKAQVILPKLEAVVKEKP
ncbi:MAG: hypothetical protein WC749_02010 [Dehalococcoidia bacterium]